jgi:hypothetical protein
MSADLSQPMHRGSPRRSLALALPSAYDQRGPSLLGEEQTHGSHRSIVTSRAQYGPCKGGSVPRLPLPRLNHPRPPPVSRALARRRSCRWRSVRRSSGSVATSPLRRLARRRRLATCAPSMMLRLSCADHSQRRVLAGARACTCPCQEAGARSQRRHGVRSLWCSSYRTAPTTAQRRRPRHRRGHPQTQPELPAVRQCRCSGQAARGPDGRRRLPRRSSLPVIE